MKIFTNKDGELRAGFKILVFIAVLVGSTLPFALLSNHVPDWLNKTGVFILVGTLLASWIMVKFADQSTMRSIGTPLKGVFDKIIKDYLIGIAAGAIAMVVIALLLNVLGADFKSNPEINYTSVLGYFLLMFSVGIYEELQFRGYLLKSLAQGFSSISSNPLTGYLIGMVLTSTLFGVAHALNPNASVISTVNIALAGFLLCLPIFVTGRLYASFGLHFAWNWFQGGVFGMPVSGTTIDNSIFVYDYSAVDSILSGGKFGPEAGILGLLGMLIAALPFFLIYYKNGKKWMVFDDSLQQ